MPDLGEKRPDPCPICGSVMAFTHIPEQTANFVGADGAMPEPIPTHDAWVCNECKHEIESA